MKLTKTGFQILLTVLVLAAAGLLIWYLMFCLQNPDVLMDATFVLRSKQVS